MRSQHLSKSKYCLMGSLFASTPQRGWVVWSTPFGLSPLNTFAMRPLNQIPFSAISFQKGRIYIKWKRNRIRLEFDTDRCCRIPWGDKIEFWSCCNHGLFCSALCCVPRHVSRDLWCNLGLCTRYISKRKRNSLNKTPSLVLKVLESKFYTFH